MRATIKMKDGAALEEKTVKDALKSKNLTFVSRSAANEEEPKVVYVLNVSGVG